MPESDLVDGDRDVNKREKAPSAQGRGVSRGQ